MALGKHRPDFRKLALAAIFLILSSSTLAWNLADRTPPPWDPADHISAAYDYYQTLDHLDLGSFAKDFFLSPHYYAPLVHIMSALLFLIFGASRLSGTFVNILSLLALLVSVEWMGRTLFSCAGADMAGRVNLKGDRKQAPYGSAGVIGLLAALLSTCYHFPAWLLHDAFLDYPLTAIVAVGLALLMRAGDFRIRRYATTFGVAAGLGMLTKQTYAFFLVLPASYAAVAVLRKRDRKAILNLALAVLVAAGIAAIWYVPHTKDVIAIYNVNRQAAINENEAPVLSFASNVHYLFGLVSPQMQVPFGLLFACGLIYSLARRRKECLMLYLSLASGLLCFTLVANKDMRYTVPVLPAAAIISVCWLADPKLISKSQASSAAKAAKSALVTAIVLWSLISFFNAQWPAEGMGAYLDMPQFRWMVFARNYYGFDHRPLASDWSVPEIVQAVSTFGQPRVTQPRSPYDSGAPQSRDRSIRPARPQQSVSPPMRWSTASQPYYSALPTLGVVVNLPHINPSSVALYARLLARERAGQPVILVEWLVTGSAADRIDECDYLLVRTGLDKAEWVAPIERTVEALIQTNPARFTRMASFPIPLRGAEAVLYRCEK